MSKPAKYTVGELIAALSQWGDDRPIEVEIYDERDEVTASASLIRLELNVDPTRIVIAAYEEGDDIEEENFGESCLTVRERN